MTFTQFDKNSIANILSPWNIDFGHLPPKAKHAYDLTEVITIDLSQYNYISLYDLLSLYLIVDAAQALLGKAHVRFAGIGPFSDYQVMPIDEYNAIRKQNINKLSSNVLSEFNYARDVYNLLSFCHHFGLFEALSFQRKAGTVTIEGISDSLLQKLHTYGGTQKSGSRVLRMIPIRVLDDVESFRVNNVISNWLSSLPPKVASAPIFIDGEFAHVFGYQLGLNIIEHSGSAWRGEYGANGVIAMRVISPQSFESMKSSFIDHPNIFESSNNDRGILEICVGDRGNGIVNTLRDAHSSFMTKFGIKSNDSIEDIIAFAFDEIGTRKDFSERLGGVHALHRILKCTSKYGGVLSLRTSGREFIYDGSSNNQFVRNASGIGIYPTSSTPFMHPFGTQFQLLLPLSNPPTQKHIIVKRNIEQVHDTHQRKFKIVEVGAYFTKTGDPETNLKLGMLRHSLMEEPSNIIIVYDFGNSQFSEEDIVLIFSSQKPVFHTHTCTCIGISGSLATRLRHRESLNIQDDSLKSESKDLFYVLSVKHRVLPVMDTEQRIWWYGLGRYNFDEVINMIFDADNGVPITDINKLVAAEDKEYLELYLKSNLDIFEIIPASALAVDIWKCRISKATFLDAQELLVRLKLPELMKAVGCIETSGYYKLPSRSDYYNRFIQSTPLLQTNHIADQITDWIIAAVRELVGASMNILLLTATGPAELIARSVASKMIGYNIHVINLGYYSALDHENLFDRDDWINTPSVIVSDIVDKETTLSQITSFCCNNNLSPKGIVSILKLTDTCVETNSLFWDSSASSISGDLPRFFISDYQRPLALTEQDVAINKEKMLFVEPYSLEVFSFASLSGAYEERYPREQLNRSRLQMLEESKSLRFGHWIYGTHHFIITTNIKKLLSDDFIGGEICGEILDIIIARKIDHVLLPLHSHICDIVSRIETAVKLTVKHKVTFTYCLSTKVLASRPFYVLPKPIKHSIKENSAQLSNFPEKQLNILILDDAVATGRTIETILRALILFGRRCMNDLSLSISPYKHIHTYAILDRQGRAKSTLLSGIGSISLFEDSPGLGDIKEAQFTFKYDRWLDVEMPVTESGACDLCEEISDLKSMVSSALIPSDHSAANEISLRIDQIRPKSTEIPSFYSYEEKKLPVPVTIGRIGAETAELVLWEFYNLTHRGNPFWGLIREYQNICSDYPMQIPEEDFEHNLEFLKIEIARILFKSWDRMNSQWAGQNWLNCMKSEISKGTYAAKFILWESGKTLAKSHKQHRGLLFDLFNFSVSKLAALTDGEDPDGQKRENIGIGLLLLVISANYHINKNSRMVQAEVLSITKTLANSLEDHSASKSLLSSMYIDEILSALRKSDFQDSFIPALLTLLNHTIRPGRHSHPHLLPALLTSFSKSKVNAAEIKLIRDILADLHYCIEILEKRYIGIFDDKSREVLPIFKRYLSQLNSSITVDKGIVSSKSQAIALKILAHYPYQPSNPIYQSLASTQIPIKYILDMIKAKCGELCPETDLEIESDIPYFETLCIIAPSIKTIEEVFINYTSKAKFDTDICSSPKLKVIVRYNDDTDSIKKISLEIYSNYDNPESLYKNIISGPGAKEINTRSFRLFRIRSIPRMVSDPVYSLCISLQFCIGYQH